MSQEDIIILYILSRNQVSLHDIQKGGKNANKSYKI